MKHLFTLCLLLFMAACTPKSEEEKTEEVTTTTEATVGVELENPFIHHVYFFLKNPDSAEDKAKLIEGLGKLGTVPTIQKHYMGFPASTDRDVIAKDYDISWLCFFKNMEEEEQYQKDPIHLKFVEEYSHLWEKVIVYDSIQD